MSSWNNNLKVKDTVLAEMKSTKRSIYLYDVLIIISICTLEIRFMHKFDLQSTCVT